jgi:hypothetical protein
LDLVLSAILSWHYPEGGSMIECDGGIPKLVFGSHWVIPEPYNADELGVIIQKSLAMPRP